MAQLVQRLVHITGMKELSEVLQGLPAELRSEIIAVAVKDGAVIMEEAAKRFAQASVRTGHLRDSITHIVRKDKWSGTAVAIVGPVVEGWGRSQFRRPTKGATTPAVRYAHLIEFGHLIAKGGSLRPEYTKTLQETGAVSSKGRAIKRWKRSSIKTAAKGAVGGFVPPKPFMRPAFETTQPLVLAALYKGINEGIEKTRAKLVRQHAHAA